jgi:hypothetical protein
MPMIAHTHGWYGVARIHLGCGFSEAFMLDPSVAATCHSWSMQVLHWLWQQRSVRRVVIATLDLWRYSTSEAGGLLRLWNAFPPWIRDIYVIRDGPIAAPGEVPCVNQAIRQRRPAGTTCAEPTATVLSDDPQADIAASSRIARVHVIDLTPFFCDAAVCFPVVGGALVLRDQTHLTAEFARTLAPYLLRAIDAHG